MSSRTYTFISLYSHMGILYINIVREFVEFFSAGFHIILYNALR